ncbi:MAG: PolC-type DNA polymerase III [Clostridiales bacterium]|nr:PolC-type DNA polymerase III [Clostridiales bacterium]
MGKPQKTFLQIFTKYQPSNIYSRILEKSKVEKTRFDRENRIVEVILRLPSLVRKSVLYAIEGETALAHGLSLVRILPKYPSELFSLDYMPEILTETERIGTVSKGFFDDSKFELQEDTIVIELPFVDGGIYLLNGAKTNEIISNIIKSEFSLDFTVQITKSKNLAQYEEARRLEQERQIAALDRSIAEITATSLAKSQRETAPFEENQNFARVASLHPDCSDVAEKIGETTYAVGFMRFDIDSPCVIYGEGIDIGEPTPIRVLVPGTGVTVLGEVVEVVKKETRRGDKQHITISITDRDVAVYVRVSLKKGETGWLNQVKPGVPLAVKGRVRTDKFDGETIIAPSAIAKIKKLERQDNAPEKRVELHLHTCLSSMDALIRPKELVETASRFGHSAIAVTDHGNVQAFPELMLAAKGSGVKIIYGMEAYFVDDTARALYGETNTSFDDEFVIFDIETTGLSPLNNHITEIGAVKVKGGEVTDIYNTYVNPGVPIPQEITRLTGITDEMVADAPRICEVLPEFFDFIGDRVLVAHNAAFDTGFIRYAAEQCGLPFANAYLDTVALSRYVNPELSSHKLNVLADYFNLGSFNHHRASDDAEMLAKIFYCMVEKLRAEGIADTDSMLDAMSEKADPLKIRPYHQIILVKNRQGLKNLYKLVSMSYLKYYRRNPRVPKTVLNEHREGLIIGSACEAGELFSAVLDGRSESDLLKIAKYYDYLEIQPISNNRFLIENGKVADEEGLRNLNRKIVEIGRKANRPVVATCDAHFLNKEDEIARKILLDGMKYNDADRDINLYFRTTEEMLAEFSYLGEETAYEVVVKNTNLISDMIEDVRPIPEGQYTPKMEGAEEDLQRICWQTAHEKYGENLPPQVETRLTRELEAIIKHGFAVLYMIARKLVKNSEERGYLVGSRGSVGSSFVATMAGITEVNPLPPHYLCPRCHYSQFIDDGSVGSGFDLPEKDCPNCKIPMDGDGHDIPFETFLGFYGDKSPDIDLNFSGDVQAEAHKYTEVLFGEENVFRAGTLGTLASKTAFGFVAKYLEKREISLSRAQVDYLIGKCIGVKRTTSQHPGGIIVIPREYEVYDFTPVQYPADDVKSGVITTHFPFEYLHDTILKLDILGHDVPTKYKMMQQYSGVDPLSIPLNDKKVLSLFASTEALGVSPKMINSETGTFGMPEFGTKFVRQMLLETKPKCFSDLLQISGLSHGTDVWVGNAQDLIKNDICTISDVVGTRDNIMVYLIYKGLDKSMAFSIMEDVRKGRGFRPEYEEAMLANDVPEWYIESCKKIKYMFPKAHAAAYVMSALRLGWYKVYYPLEFYAAFFSVAPGGFDGEIVMRGRSHIFSLITAIEEKGKDATPKETEMLAALQLANECLARGIEFLPVDLYKSHPYHFLPENGKIRMPLNCLPGLGDTAALRIGTARVEGEFSSVEDLRQRAQVTKTVIEVLKRNGVIDFLSETDQLSFF